MELAYLKKLYQDGLFDVYSGFDTWEEAVKAACSPLIRRGWWSRPMPTAS